MHGGEGGVARAGHDLPVEAQVEGAGIAGRGDRVRVLQPVEEGADAFEVLVGGPGRGDRGGVGFDHAPDPQDLQEGPVRGDLRQHAEGLQEVLRAQRGDVDAGAVPDLQHPQGGEGADGLADRTAGDPQAGGEVALCGQALLWSYLSLGDHRFDLFDRPLRHRRTRAVTHVHLQLFP